MKTAPTNQSPLWKSDAALIALALMWGTSHVITKDIFRTHSPAFYTSLRFGIAALCFGLLFAKHLRGAKRPEVWQGVLLGLCSFAGIAFYTSGLVFTQASKAGFISGMYLVFTPLVSYLLFRARPTRDHVTGLVIAVGGFALLSYPRSGESLNWGDILILIAAVAWATHIAATSAFAGESAVKTLAAVQVMVVAVLAIAIYFVFSRIAHSAPDAASLPALVAMEGGANPVDGRFLVQIVYMAVMVTFVAALVQTWAQRAVAPTHAVILYALEPVTAAVFAYFVLGETLGWRRGIGAGLIVAGVLVSRLRLASRLTGETSIEAAEKILPVEMDT